MTGVRQPIWRPDIDSKSFGFQFADCSSRPTVSTWVRTALHCKLEYVYESGSSPFCAMTMMGNLAPEARRYLPKILPINHSDWRSRCIKVVKQTRIHAYAAGGIVPAAIWLKSWAVAEGAAPTRGAEMVRHQFGLPAVNRIAGAITGKVKFIRFVIRMQHAAL